MRRWVGLAMAVALGGVLGVGIATLQSDCKRVRSHSGECILVKNGYALIIPSGHTMQQALGETWRDATVFYGVDVTMLEGEIPAMRDPWPLRPAGRGAPVMFVRGDHWESVGGVLYGLESARLASVRIDLPNCRIEASSPPTSPPVTFTQDGWLMIDRGAGTGRDSGAR